MPKEYKNTNASYNNKIQNAVCEHNHSAIQDNEFVLIYMYLRNSNVRLWYDFLSTIFKKVYFHGHNYLIIIYVKLAFLAAQILPCNRLVTELYRQYRTVHKARRSSP